MALLLAWQRRTIPRTNESFQQVCKGEDPLYVVLPLPSLSSFLLRTSPGPISPQKFSKPVAIPFYRGISPLTIAPLLSKSPRRHRALQERNAPCLRRPRNPPFGQIHRDTARIPSRPRKGQVLGRRHRHLAVDQGVQLQRLHGRGRQALSASVEMDRPYRRAAGGQEGHWRSVSVEVKICCCCCSCCFCWKTSRSRAATGCMSIAHRQECLF